MTIQQQAHGHPGDVIAPASRVLNVGQLMHRPTNRRPLYQLNILGLCSDARPVESTAPNILRRKKVQQLSDLINKDEWPSWVSAAA